MRKNEEGKLVDENGLTEEEFLSQYQPRDYERPSVTVDMLIFAVDKRKQEASVDKAEKSSVFGLLGAAGRLCGDEGVSAGGGRQGVGGGNRRKGNASGAALHIWRGGA